MLPGAIGLALVLALVQELLSDPVSRPSCSHPLSEPAALDAQCQPACPHSSSLDCFSIHICLPLSAWSPHTVAQRSRPAAVSSKWEHSRTFSDKQAWISQGQPRSTPDLTVLLGLWLQGRSSRHNRALYRAMERKVLSKFLSFCMSHRSCS